MKSALPISIGFLLALCSSAFAQPAPAAPAEMISNYRVQHGEGPVTSDPTLNRIAHEQAAAMASKDLLDHNSALAPFAHCYNKLFLTTPGHHRRYLDETRRLVDEVAWLPAHERTRRWITENRAIGYTPEMFGFEIIPFL